MTKSKRWIAGLAGMALVAGTASAQNYGQQSGSQPQYGSQQSGSHQTQVGQQSSQSGKFRDAKELTGKDVKDQQGNKIGEIKHVLFNLQSGETFVAVGLQGDKSALVPAQALNISGSRDKPDVTIPNISKQTVENGLTVNTKDWDQALDNQSFKQRLYSQFHTTQPSSGMGSGGSSLEGDSSQGQEGTSSQSGSSSGQGGSSSIGTGSSSGSSGSSSWPGTSGSSSSGTSGSSSGR